MSILGDETKGASLSRGNSLTYRSGEFNGVDLDWRLCPWIRQLPLLTVTSNVTQLLLDRW